MGMFIGIMIGFLLIAAVFYIAGCWLFSRVLHKCGYENPVDAYIPIVNYIAFLKVTNQNPKNAWWLLGMIIPVVNFIAWIPTLIFSIKGGYRLSKKIGETGWFTLMLIIGPANIWGWWYLGRKKVAVESQEEVQIIQTAASLITTMKSKQEILDLMSRSGIESKRAEELYGFAKFQVDTGAEVIGDHQPIATWIIIILTLACLLLGGGSGGDIDNKYGKYFKGDPGENLQKLMDSPEMRDLQKQMKSPGVQDMIQKNLSET